MGAREEAAEAARAAGAEMADFEVVGGELTINDQPFAVGSIVSLHKADGDILIAAGRLKVSEATVKAASHGLNVVQLKEALAAKGIEPPGDAKKADLAKLLDDAPASDGEVSE
jgi:hypothetical protein